MNRTLFSVLLLIISGCMHSGIPLEKVDATWIGSTCQSIPYSERTPCSQYSNCNNQASGVCRCTWDEGASVFIGNFKNDAKWCGVYKGVVGSYLVTNGKLTEQQLGVNWGDTALLIIGVAAAAALIDEAADSGGGYPSSSSSTDNDDYPLSVIDSDWDWDGFWNSGTYVWMCRGIQTGRFAPNEKCAFDYKDDSRWPSN